MNNDFTFAIKSIRFDENYQPSDNTRITTNFANLLVETTAERICAMHFE